MADDARLEYLTGRMMEDADGSKLWTTYEDFCGEKDQALTLACRFQVMVYLQGMQPDFLENTPEAVAMREVEQELTDLAKEQVRLEVEDAAKVEQEEAEKAAQKEAKKKAAAKKRATAKKKKAAETKK
jgi:DNA gyrase/topoisomerase IV subunit B